MKAKAPPLENITRIGIDEVSYRKRKENNRDLFSGYLLKEQLREVFRNKDWQGAFML